MATKPIAVVISKWERVKRQTVWHPLNTDPADVHRWTPRIWLPTYDILAIALGVYAYIFGSPLLNHLFPQQATQSAAALLVASSVTMLVGVILPKLMILELIGKMVLVFMLAAYAGTVAFMSRTNEPNGFVVIVLAMAVWLILPRITELFGSLGKQRAIKKQSKARKAQVS